MNKMNIPAPFRMALPTPPLPPSVPEPLPPPPPPPLPPAITENTNFSYLSSGESEMESSEEVLICFYIPRALLYTRMFMLCLFSEY